MSGNIIESKKCIIPRAQFYAIYSKCPSAFTVSRLLKYCFFFFDIRICLSLYILFSHFSNIEYFSERVSSLCLFDLLFSLSPIFVEFKLLLQLAIQTKQKNKNLRRTHYHVRRDRLVSFCHVYHGLRTRCSKSRSTSLTPNVANLGLPFSKPENGVQEFLVA